MGSSAQPSAEVRCKTIHEIVFKSASQQPEAPALLALDGCIVSYAQLLTQVDATVAQLNTAGVGRGHTVAIVLPNGPQMAATFCGVASAARCAPLNPAYGKEEFEFYLDDLEAAALITNEETGAAARAVAKDRGIPTFHLSANPASVFHLEFASNGGALAAGRAAQDEIALLLHTSGTTSRPKLVPLLHEHLCASAHNICNTLQLSAQDRCLNVMPLFHIHGLVAAILASLHAGASIVCTDGFHPVKFFRWLEEFKPTWFTAVPTMHQALLARAAQEPAPSKTKLRFLRSSSASLPPNVMADLEKLFQAPVIEAYGMTEAAHQMASNPLPPGERKPGSVGRAAGSDIAILNQSGEKLASRQKGEVVIRGDNVTTGYVANEKANQLAFTDGWFRTGDQGYLDEDSYLFLTGRLKEIINRGGEKISPREVDEVLLRHRSVEQAVTFAIPHDRLGEEIGAAVVTRAGHNLSDRDVREHAAAHLADFKVPRIVKLVDSIPKGPTGKLQRIGLADKLGVSPISTPIPASNLSAEAPSSEVERQLAELWAEILAHRNFGVNDDFFALGGTSLAATQLLTRLEKHNLGSLAAIDFVEEPTVAGMAKRLETGSNSLCLPEGLVLLQPKGSLPPLFCAAAHDGSLLGFASLSRHLGTDQPIIGFAPDPSKGLELTLDQMAELLAGKIREYQRGGPYHLLGFCFGGKLLFEAACQLQQAGESVGFLGLINSFHTRTEDDSERLSKEIENFVRRTKFHLRRTLALKPPEMYRYVRNRTRAVVEDALVTRLYRLTRHLGERAAKPFCTRRVRTTIMAREWEPRPFAGPVILMADSVPRAHVHPSTSMGWGGLVPKESPVFVIPSAGHEFWSDECSRFIAEKVAEQLPPRPSAR